MFTILMLYLILLTFCYSSYAGTVALLASKESLGSRIFEGAMAGITTLFLPLTLILIYAGRGYAGHWRLDLPGGMVEITLAQGGKAIGIIEVPGYYPLLGFLPMLLGVVISGLLYWLEAVKKRDLHA